jgi:hypothetical protein
MRGNQSVPPHRQALRAWLLFLPGSDLFTNWFLHAAIEVGRDKVMAGGTPANPATPAFDELDCLILRSWLTPT